MIDRRRSGLANTCAPTGGGVRGASSLLHGSHSQIFTLLNVCYPSDKDSVTVVDCEPVIDAGFNLANHRPVGADWQTYRSHTRTTHNHTSCFFVRLKKQTNTNVSTHVHNWPSEHWQQHLTFQFDKRDSLITGWRWRATKAAEETNSSCFCCWWS